jgi:hypothetical protein
MPQLENKRNQETLRAFCFPTVTIGSTNEMIIAFLAIYYGVISIPTITVHACHSFA